MTTHVPYAASRLLLMIAVIALSAGSACAQSAAPAEAPMKKLFKLGNFATDTVPPKEFVVKSRPSPDKLDYLPVHVRPAARPGKIYTPAEAKAKEAELDELRLAHDRLANRPTVSLTSADARKKPAKSPLKSPRL